jgi:hypothetical protein
MTTRLDCFEVDENKKYLAYVIIGSVFIRGLGGFGYKGKNILSNLPKKPTQNPDHTLVTKT